MYIDLTTPLACVRLLSEQSCEVREQDVHSMSLDLVGLECIHVLQDAV